MSLLAVEQVSKTFRDGHEAVNALTEVSLSVNEGEFVSIIGPSGCGKSTLLDMVAGIQTADQGDIFYKGKSILGKRGVFGYMPQNDVLFPWRTVIDNVILPLEVNGISPREAKTIAQPYFNRFGLDGFQKRYPRSLSGGMRQRANFLRAILPKQPLLLLDEPFGRLDALTRKDLQLWLLERWEEVESSILLVTHDIDEAISLSDRIYVMSDRPGNIKYEVTVPFNRPRDPNIPYTHEFAELKKKLTEQLRSNLL